MSLRAHLSNELIREGAPGSKTLHLQRHVLLGLRVERGVDNETVDEDPHVVFYLERLDLDAALVFLLDGLDQLLDEDVGDMIHMSTSL